eukprot:TRINITY_DN32127_c0_g1_i1.p1 TRINITY_DN32127_c0_g1~~TRINITY_DN32127_c0_g1_i1.p1  ORF type:complete len:202 (-),score=28.69 TRINITY_DN32127_c0_g1_i1:326-931(-)
MHIWDTWIGFLTILGTVSAARFDHTGTYQQNHFPKRVNTRFPGSIKAASKFIFIFPENVIKNNLSKKSSHQNERKLNHHQDHCPGSKQMMTKPTLLGKTQFGHPVKVIKRDQRLWKDSRLISEPISSPDTFMTDHMAQASSFPLRPLWNLDRGSRKGKEIQGPCPTFDPGGKSIHQLLYTRRTGGKDKRLYFKLIRGDRGA